MAPDRSHLSIGDTLTLLKAEFPDVTISKIRFLEAQGLIDPERTASGYRKFTDDDIERLRFILRSQQQEFLPLKVIRDRLDEDGVQESFGVVGGEGAPAPAKKRKSAKRARPRIDDQLYLTAEQLAESTNVSVERIAELEKFGLITGRVLPSGTWYDEDAMTVVNLAEAFSRFGIEARHLKVYKNAAEREVGTFEQIVLPLLKQRDPQSQTEALAMLSELSQLGQTLRTILVRQNIHKLTET